MPESLWSRVVDLPLTIAEHRWESVAPPGEPEHGRYILHLSDGTSAPAAAVGVRVREVLARFPDAILEDPHDLPEVAELLAPHAARVSFDAPIATAADITTSIVNVKPSRIGSVRALLDIYDHCEQAGVRMYGGGMGEREVARGQIELLASLFHPDSTNDVAPSPYNQPDLTAGLPQSPLVPGASAPGFRWS